MSEHSKWATIRHKKGALDAKRGKVFSKLAKEILLVARQGGGNPEDNPTLRTLVQKAKSVNMPNDNIERAIKKGTGELAGETLEEVMYEGFAAGGVGLIVKALTDNKNRATAEIRHIFSKHGSSFAVQGAVSRGFERRGRIYVGADKADEDALMTLVIESGADDMELDEGKFEILTQPQEFENVRGALEAAGIAIEDPEVTLVPSAWVTIGDLAQARSVMRFVEALEDNDDVQEVYTNMNVDEAILGRLSDED